ncbi:MAG: DUF1573 domain-containing protein, partial [Phycisphaerae bacterium]|nr:DUF1573 domain-containing protein [Phycisphaerae bacterium]
MNTIVEYINSAGFSFIEFAVPMLVQSGILIVILLLADLLLRKKVKAVFRYWIWMLVLVKLVLPTSLSSPLSLGYLFGEKLTYQDLAETTSALELAEPAPAENLPGINPLYIQPNPYVPPKVPVASVVEPEIAEPVSPPAEPVTPLAWQGVVFLVWLAVVITMGLLLLQRALFVRGLVAQAKKASRLMNDELAYCCATMRIKYRVGLKVSPNATTPSVCGLIRPVILVPWNLASTLGASRLRTVLMHELAHIKRADLWVNLAQTALQIIYFYNPLLWLANCVIRRIREQAVDEAVLVAMGEGAQQYPQTLVDVAKMAFKRPALSLRLIGVVESESALAGRIKHILGRPIPKTAKLGIVGVLAVVIAGAILLPMARAKNEGGFSDKDLLIKFAEIPEGSAKKVSVDDTTIWSKSYEVEFAPGQDLLVVVEMYQAGQPMRIPGRCIFEGSQKPEKFTITFDRAYQDAAKRSVTHNIQFKLGDQVFKIPVHTPRYLSTQWWDWYRGEGLRKPEMRYTKTRYAGIETLFYYGAANLSRESEYKAKFWIPGRDVTPVMNQYGIALKMIPLGSLKYLYVEPIGGYQGLDGKIISRSLTLERADLIADEYKQMIIDSVEKQWTAEKQTEPEVSVGDASLDHFVGRYALAGHPDTAVFEIKKEGDVFIFSGLDVPKFEMDIFLRGLEGRRFEMEKGRDNLKFGDNPRERYRVRYNAAEDRYILDSLGMRGEVQDSMISPLTDLVKISAEKPDGTFAATLPNGVTVELMGVCELPSEGKQWWAADGSLLEDIFWEGSTANRESSVDARQVVFRIRSDESDPALAPTISFQPKRRLQPPGSWSGAFFVKKDNQTLEEFRGCSFSLHDDHPTIDISADIGYGPWKRQATKRTNSYGNIVSTFTGIGTLILNDPTEKNGKTTISATLLSRVKAWRFVAVDKQGNIHNSGSASSIGLDEDTENKTPEHQICTGKFALPLSQIDKFQFQTRQVETITFKNVSLEPNFKTDVQVESDTTEAVPVLVEAIETARAGISLPIRTVFSGKTDKGGSFEWETSIDPRVRFRHGWYTVEDGAVREHVGGGSQIPEESKLNLKLDVEVKDNMLNLKVQRVHDSADGSRTEAVAGKTAVPAGAHLKHVSTVDSAVLTNKHLNLWQGDFISDGKVVKSVIYAAYLTTPDDQETGFKPPELQKGEIVTTKVGPDTWPGIESSVSPKLVILLDAINSCAAETDLNIDSISITDRNISIKGDASSRANSRKFLDAVKDNGLKVSSVRLNAAGSRDKFIIIVEPKKDWQQWFQQRKTDVQLGLEETISPKLVMLLAAIKSVAAEAELNIDSISIKDNKIEIKGDTAGRTNTLKFLDAVKDNGLEVLRLSDIARDNRNKFSLVVEPKKDWRQWWQQHKTDIEADFQGGWGEAVDGIICAVKPVKESFFAGEIFEFDITYKNVSDHPITVCKYPDYFYVWTRLEILASKGNTILSGRHANGIYLSLKASDFATLQPGQTASVRQKIEGYKLDLLGLPIPGKYAAKVSINEINRMHEHIPKFDEFCRKNNIKPWTGSIKSGPAAFMVIPMPEIQWGEEAEGLHVGTGEPEVKDGSIKVPAFLSNKRSDDKKYFDGADYQIILNNKLYLSYQWPALNSRQVTVYPEQVRGPFWIDLSDYVNESDRDQSYQADRPLKQLPKGKYNLRVIYVGRNGKPRISSPEINVTIPDDSSWGEAVEGVQVRLRPVKDTWEAEEKPVFKADIRNRGGLELSVSTADEKCQLEVDGLWYGWSGPWGIPNIERSLLGPGSQINDISISLAKKWVGPRKALTLTAGMHTVRVAFILQRPERKNQDLVRAISNPIEIKILPAKTDVVVEGDVKVKKEGLVWGKQVNGLRAALEFVPEKEAYSIGEQIGVRLHVHNTTGKPIQFISETWRQDDRATVEDEEGNLQPVGHTWYSGRPRVERYYLKPGEQVVLESSAFGLAADYKQAESLGHPVGCKLVCKQGIYSVSFSVRLPGIRSSSLPPQEDDWEGVLQTEKHRLVVTAASRPDQMSAVPVGNEQSVVGEWEDVGNPIPADFNDTIALTEQIKLGSIGRDVEGKSFITFVWDKEKDRNRQYRFVLINKNDAILEPDSHLVLDENGRLEEKFTFDETYVPWRLKEFKFQSRPLPLAGPQSISSQLQKDTSTAFEGKTISPSELAPPGRYAIELDGVDDYLFVPDSPTLRLEPPFTVEMWIKPKLPEQKPDRLQQWGVIAQGGYIGTGRVKPRGFGIELIRFEKEPAKFNISYSEANDRGINGSEYGRYSFDEWIHISHVFEGGNYKPGPGHPLVVGKFLIPVPEPFMGQIGEVRIWNTARTREEIRRYKDVALTGKEPGLAACWTFEQAEGQFAYDISGNNNHGRLGKVIEADDADPKWVDLEAAAHQPGRIADVSVVGEGTEAVSGESQVKPAANEEGPRITFENLVCDLGRIASGTKHVCEFKYTNTGNEVLKITRVGAACACTVPQKTRECAPGESGTLKVTYQSGTNAGKVKKYVYVHSNDKVNPRVKLTIKAEIVIKVAHEPKRLNLVLDKENAGCPAITLTSLDDQPFSITGFKSTGDSLTADFDSSLKRTSFVIRPMVDMEKLRKGMRGQININLTHPDCKKLMIVFETLPEFKTDPRVIYVREAEPQKPVTRRVRILSNYNEDFEIESTSSRNGTIKVLAQEKVRDGYQFELRITPPEQESKRRVFTDVFTVMLKGAQQLQITCYGIYAKKPAETTEKSTSKTNMQTEVEQSSSESGGDGIVVVSKGKSTMYSSIKEAVDAAPAGSVIRVDAGVYGERPELEVEQSIEASEATNAALTVPEAAKTRGGISGVVVSSVTGEPIAGAYVGVGDFGDSGGSNYSRHRSEGFHDKTKTDEKGRFELNGLVFIDKHRDLEYHPLVVTHPDFVRHDEKIKLLSGEPAPDVKVSLRPAAKIGVTIVDAEGNPLEGQWLLRLEALDGRRFIPPGSDPHLSSFASNVWAHWPDMRANLGVSSGFTFTELDSGRYSIEAIR